MNLWPSGDSDKLRAAAAGWRSAQGDLATAAADLDKAIRSVTDTSDCDDILAMYLFWSKFHSAGNNATVLTGLPALCGELARACEEYAGSIESTKTKMIAALAGVGVVATIVSVAGVFLTPATAGTSDAGAMAIDAAVVTGTLVPIAAGLVAVDGGIVAAATLDAVIAATADIPTIQIIQSETHDIDSALQRELATNPGTAQAYIPAPKNLPAFPGAKPAKRKTSVQGGGGLRKRWVDSKGKIYEWDSQHGTVEVYNKRGKHEGEYDPETGEQTKPADGDRSVEP